MYFFFLFYFKQNTFSEQLFIFLKDMWSDYTCNIENGFLLDFIKKENFLYPNQIPAIDIIIGQSALNDKRGVIFLPNYGAKSLKDCLGIDSFLKTKLSLIVDKIGKFKIDKCLSSPFCSSLILSFSKVDDKIKSLIRKSINYYVRSGLRALGP